MDLKHSPTDGISITEDLSNTEVTLTRRRGGDILVGIIGAGMMFVLAFFTDMNVGAFAGVVMMFAGVVLNQVKTSISLGPRALVIERRTFGRQTIRETVPYEAIRAIDIVGGRLGQSRMTLQRVGGSDIVITHGNPADHEQLRLAIDRHRPIAPVASEEELRAPAALRALQQKQSG